MDGGEEDQLHKGELWATARLAGIMAAKKPIASYLFAIALHCRRSTLIWRWLKVDSDRCPRVY